ncbi:MAG: acyl transferase [Bacteroidetes bacterium HGW-Bacteroidetes-4]|jgi:phenylacetate-coenzyme A ligase PaaK-like adenylate-forming protein|nr:MAG: acyl transferase [Bacteroidetes bacterium HGW-Bacteroidetes-4]
MKYNLESWNLRMTGINNETDFNALAIEAFHFQYEHVDIYKAYCDSIGCKTHSIEHFSQIPALPISFFKTHKVLAKNKKAELHFKSSGTTGANTSNHFVHQAAIYETSFLKGFQLFYGEPSEYCILALLPSYIEQGNSSLVYMANSLIGLSKHLRSGFFLNNYRELSATLHELEQSGQKTLLLGVTYALLDLAEQFPQALKNTLIMETGGMKGRRKELIREDLHRFLCDAFQVKSIHSEYGMTELLSQAYSKGEGVFETPPWLKVLVRDTYDPYALMPQNRSGGINLIDLANIFSCCFIETKDLGKLLIDNAFTIIGRFDNSDIRGCNLMVS